MHGGHAELHKRIEVYQHVWLTGLMGALRPTGCSRDWLNFRARFFEDFVNVGFLSIDRNSAKDGNIKFKEEAQVKVRPHNAGGLRTPVLHCLTGWLNTLTMACGPMDRH